MLTPVVDDLALLEYPLVHTSEADIREYELEPAIADGRPVEFVYDHPDRGEEVRRALPFEIKQGREGAYVIAHDLDRDNWRYFRLERIRKARAEG